MSCYIDKSKEKLIHLELYTRTISNFARTLITLLMHMVHFCSEGKSAFDFVKKLL